MADFWAGVAQGFGPAYQRSTDRRQLIEDRKLARTQGLEDAAAAELRAAKQKMVALGGGQGGAGWTQSDTRLLDVGTLHDVLARINQLEARNKRWAKEEKAADLKEQRGHEEKVRQRVRQNQLVDIKTDIERKAEKERTTQAGILESLTPLAKEAALGGRTLFTGKQPLPATSWKGQELGPDVLKGLPKDDVGQIGKYDALSPAQRQGAVLAGQRVEKEEIAAKAAEKAAERERKAKLDPRWQPTAKPEVSTEDAVDKIIQMRGQLGPQGSRGPQPSREALLKMGRGKIMQLYGAFTQQVAGIVQPTQSERDDAKLDEYADEFDTASPDRQAQITRKAQTILSKRGDGKWTPEDVTKYLQSGQPPKEEVVPFKETAEERKSRLQFQHGIIRLDDLIQEADEDDFTGVFPQLKSTLLDEILPALTIDKFSDEKRMTFRHRAMILSQNLLRALNEEGKLSETDAVRILPLTPQASDDNPMFKAKLKGIRELLVDKLKLQDAGAGREDVFSLEPADFFSKLGRPDKRLGGVIVIPEGMAPSIIKLMPQYRYIGGDKSKPVTGDYISGLFREGKIDENAATLWIHYLGLPIK